MTHHEALPIFATAARAADFVLAVPGLVPAVLVPVLPVVVFLPYITCHPHVYHRATAML